MTTFFHIFLLAFLLPFFLTGETEPHAGNGLESGLRNGLAAFAAAGFPVYPFRAFLLADIRGLTQCGFAFNSFQFRSLIKNIHKLLLKGSFPGSAGKSVRQWG